MPASSFPDIEPPKVNVHLACELGGLRGTDSALAIHGWNRCMILFANPRVVMVRLSGEYHAANSAALQNQLSELYDADLTLVDMRDVTEIDASCSAVFLQVARNDRMRSRPRMVGTRSSVSSQLDFFGLHETFAQYTTLQDALESL